MGMVKNIYFGPYFRCINEKISTQEDYFGCGNMGCNLYKKEFTSNFCKNCGCAPVSLQRPEVSDRIDLNVVIEKLQVGFKESMFYVPFEGSVRGHENDNIFVPNIDRSNPRNFYIENSSIVALNNNSVELERSWLLTSFSEEFGYLKSQYLKNVYVECGLLVYYY